MMQPARKMILKPFADRAHPAISAVDVELLPARGNLYLFRYRIVGNVQELRIPVLAQPRRADGLWRHTCLELFLAAGGKRYYEFNFSPSTCWAAYRFDDYREGMEQLPLASAPRIEVDSADGSVTIDVAFDLGTLIQRDLPLPAAMGLAAVVEDRHGRLSYWALAHPSAKPDFHHRDGFIAKLAHNVV